MALVGPQNHREKKPIEIISDPELIIYLKQIQALYNRGKHYFET